MAALRRGTGYAPEEIKAIKQALDAGEIGSLRDIADCTGVGNPVQASRMLEYAGYRIHMTISKIKRAKAGKG